jgi:hypothetical protein
MSALRKLIGSGVLRTFVLCAALAVIMQGAAASLAVACSLSPDHDARFSQMHDGQASDHHAMPHEMDHAAPQHSSVHSDHASGQPSGDDGAMQPLDCCHWSGTSELTSSAPISAPSTAQLQRQKPASGNAPGGSQTHGLDRPPKLTVSTS